VVRVHSPDIMSHMHRTNPRRFGCRIYRKCGSKPLRVSRA